MDITGIRFSVSLGVVIDNVLLELDVQLCVAVVDEELCKVFLLDNINHRFLVCCG